MMRFVCILVVLASGSAAAEPAVTAAEYVAAGRLEFEKGHYAAAYSEYRSAFALESTAENAFRMLIAAGYAADLPSASATLDIWLLKKREDAKRLGDSEASWQLVDSVSKALHFGVAQKERRIQELEKQLVDLQRKNTQLQVQISSTQTTVQSIQAGYEKQLNDLKARYEDRLDKLRGSLQSNPSGGTFMLPTPHTP